jgi:two-component system CheB/CheR fusion protein
MKESPPRLLVVDDAPELLQMVATFFRLLGYEVETAVSAPGAIDAAGRERFDAVVSDIGMPGMNGYQLAEVLRALPAYRGVPLVAVTGFDQYDDPERAGRAGFNAYMKKPFEPAELLEVIRGLL